jgi:uncharacterized membrane protein YobD (UPF0266 family)
MNASPYLPTQRFELYGRDYRPIAVIIFVMLLILTLILSLVFPISHPVPITAMVFMVMSGFAMYMTLRSRKGLVFNEDGVIFGKRFVAWSDIALYYFYETEDSEGNTFYYLRLRLKNGSQDIGIYLDEIDYDGEMADHILPFGEAFGGPRGYAK